MRASKTGLSSIRVRWSPKTALNRTPSNGYKEITAITVTKLKGSKFDAIPGVVQKKASGGSSTMPGGVVKIW